jgi:hypothetical protein
MIIKELKNGWNNNGLYVPNNETNNDYQEIKKYIAEGGEYEKFDWLADAKTQKINELNTFIFAEKTKPYTTFTAPELVPSIVNGKTQFKQSEPVSFIWYVDAIPNSKLTPESILNKCNLDMTSCIKASILDVKSIDLASLKANLKICLDSKIIPYTTTITKEIENKKVQSIGMVNVFPIAESLANHIQQREVNSNVLNSVYLSQINNCKTIPEVEAIKFTTGA